MGRFFSLLHRLFRLVPALPTLVLGAMVLGAPVQATEVWSLNDGAGHRFRTTVFEQPFPEYPSGWRIRLNEPGR